jgi:hypothetical protein
MIEKLSTHFFAIPPNILAEPDPIKRVKDAFAWVRFNIAEFNSNILPEVIKFFKLYVNPAETRSIIPSVLPDITEFLSWVSEQPDPVSNESKLFFFDSMKKLYQGWGVAPQFTQALEQKIHTIKIFEQIAENCGKMTQSDKKLIQETKNLIDTVLPGSPANFEILHFQVICYYFEGNFKKAYEIAEEELHAASPHQLWRAVYNVLNLAAENSDGKRVNELLEKYQLIIQLIMEKPDQGDPERTNLFRDAIAQIKQKCPDVIIPESYHGYL